MLFSKFREIILSQHFLVFSNSFSLAVGSRILPHIPSASLQPVFPLVFPQLNLHSGGVRRNPERLPSSRCIESAQTHHARELPLPPRASDTSLRLLESQGDFHFSGKR
jgi:hypothetical protein